MTSTAPINPAVRLAVLTGAIVAASALSACGSDTERALVGYRIAPLTNVGTVTVDNASAANEPFPFRADDGRLLVVFLGFTNCPDACPTALAEVRQALARLGDDAVPIDVAMLTIDPLRDTPDVLTEFVRGFVDDGVALRTEDTDELRQLADAFRATYDTAHDHNGMTTDVGHTDQTYLVDAQGDVVLTWTADMTTDDLENDLRIFLADLDTTSQPT